MCIWYQFLYNKLLKQQWPLLLCKQGIPTICTVSFLMPHCYIIYHIFYYAPQINKITVLLAKKQDKKLTGLWSRPLTYNVCQSRRSSIRWCVLITPYFISWKENCFSFILKRNTCQVWPMYQIFWNIYKNWRNCGYPFCWWRILDRIIAQLGNQI